MEPLWEKKVMAVHSPNFNTSLFLRIFLTLRFVLKSPLNALLEESRSSEGLLGMVSHSAEKKGDARLKYLVLSVLLLRLLQRSGYVSPGHDRELDLLELLHRLLQGS